MAVEVASVMGVLITALMVAVEVFLLVAFGPHPVIVACLVACSLLFIAALVMEARQ